VSNRRRQHLWLGIGTALLAVTGLAVTSSASADFFAPGTAGAQRPVIGASTAVGDPSVDLNNDLVPGPTQSRQDPIESGAYFGVSFVNRGPFPIGEGTLSPTYKITLSAPTAIGVDSLVPGHACLPGNPRNLCVVELSERWAVGETIHLGSAIGNNVLEVFPSRQGVEVTYSATSAFPDADGASATFNIRPPGS
jgi:hypothetical protein